MATSCVKNLASSSPVAPFSIARMYSRASSPFVGMGIPRTLSVGKGASVSGTFALFHRREIRSAKPDYVGLFQCCFILLRFRHLLKFRIATECLPVLRCLL